MPRKKSPEAPLTTSTPAGTMKVTRLDLPPTKDDGTPAPVQRKIVQPNGTTVRIDY
jgi:hypothetical protein